MVIGSLLVMHDGTYQEQEFNDDNQVIGVTTTDYSYALDGLYVGDMPQTSYIFGLTLKPIKGMRLQLYKTYDRNFGDWSLILVRLRVMVEHKFGKLGVILNLIYT